MAAKKGNEPKKASPKAEEEKVPVAAAVSKPIHEDSTQPPQAEPVSKKTVEVRKKGEPVREM